jgi:hypothetical protein
MNLPMTRFYPNDLSDIKRVFSDHFRRSKSKRYENVVEYVCEEIQNIPDLFGILNTVENEFELSRRGFSLEKLWLVESFPEDITEGELPFIPHIDYQRFLKVMIYVDNVNTECGPFSAITCDPEIWEDRRLALPANYKQSLQNQITEFAMDEYKPFVGEPGTIILFDTNCPHFAGVVSPGNSRRVFRFDYLKPEWRRSESQFSKFKRTVSRMIFS